MDAPVDPRFASAPCLFFVIGAQKAGTTWLHRYFQTHPDIRVPDWKETNYWAMVEGRPNSSMRLERERERRAAEPVRARVLKTLGLRRRSREERAGRLLLRAAEAPVAPHRIYADVLFGRAAARAVGEVTPQYAMLGEATYRVMAALNPNTRFLFVLRDPVDRILSGLRHRLRTTMGGSGFDETDLRRSIERLLEGRDAGALARSRFDTTVARLDAAVPRDRVLYLFYEELFDQANVDRICGFLGVAPRAARVDRVIHKGAGAELAVTPVHIDALTETLAPTYAALRDRFGPAIPASWKSPGVPGQGGLCA